MRKSIAWVSWLTALFLLGSHAWLVIDASHYNSVTVDEAAHLPAGISYLQRHTFALYHHNPPLVKGLAAVASLPSLPKVDYSTWEADEATGRSPRLWPFAWTFMYANASRYHEIFNRARIPVIALSVLAGLVVFLWARELFGPAGALVSLSLWSFCPNVLAHAGLVTTDMGATSLGFVATYLFWRWLKKPSIERLLLAGVVLGLAQLTKFSLLLLYPIWVLCWGIGRWRRTPDMLSPPRVAGLAAIFVLSVLVINVGYGLEGTGAPLGSYTLVSELFTRSRSPGSEIVVSPGHPWARRILERQNRFADTWLGRLRVPLPLHYVLGFDEQRLEAEGVGGKGYSVYLLGELRHSGWWWYYLFALGVKVPLGTWFLTALAVVTPRGRRQRRNSTHDESILWITSLSILLGMAAFTDVNLGLRYVLPMFPFWFVSLGRVAMIAPGRQPLAIAAIVLALSWNVAACRIHPHYLAYFNESIGGPARGGDYLIDSNLDWGQDLENLASWLARERPGELLGLAYFGGVDPAILRSSGNQLRFRIAPTLGRNHLLLDGPKRDSRAWRFLSAWERENGEVVREWVREHPELSPRAIPALRDALSKTLGLAEGPQPGLFAVSANFVYGLPFRLFDEEGNLWNVGAHAFSYFRRLEPIAKVGYSIFVYDVSFKQAARIRREMGLPQLGATDEQRESDREARPPPR